MGAGQRQHQTPGSIPRAAPPPEAPAAAVPSPPAPPPAPAAAPPLPSVEALRADPARWRTRLVEVDGVEMLRRLWGAEDALGVLQLKPGRLRGTSWGVAMGAVRVTVSHLSHAVRVWDHVPPGPRQFAFVRQMTGYGAMQGQPIRPGDLLEFLPGQPYEGYCAEDYHWVAVEIHPDVLQRALRGPEAPDLIDAGSVRLRRIGPQAYLRLERLTDDLVALQGRAVTRADLEPHAAAWTALVAEALVTPGGATPRISARALAAHEVLAKAEVFARHHMGEPLYLEEVRRASGASERNLQQLFRRRFGTTPIEYLGLLRMHRVRDALCAARGDPTARVGELARRWVQGHLGRFARTYRAHFGESPSDTLRGPTRLPALPPPTAVGPSDGAATALGPPGTGPLGPGPATPPGGAP